MPGEDRAWKAGIKKGEFAEVWPRAAALSAEIVETVRASGFPAGVDLLNVNFPIGADLHTPRVITQLANVGYERLFRRKQDGVYVHDASGELRESGDLDGTDVSILRMDRVSITPVRLAHAARLDPELQGRLEKSSR